MANISLGNITNETPSCFFLITEFHHVKYITWTFVFASALNSVLSITSTIGNTIVLLTIWKNPSLHTPSYCLLFSLAVSDLGVGLVVQPLCVVYKLSEMKQNFLTYCISGLASEILAIMFSTTTLFTIGAISVERYLAIHLHLRYKELVPVSRIIKVIALLWCFGLVCPVVRLFCNHIGCHITTAISVTIFVILLVIIVVCYIKIGMTVRRHLKLEVHPAKIPMSTCEPGASTSRDNASNHGNIQMNQMKKSVITTLYVVGAFVGCFAPYAVTIVICVVLNWNPFARGLLNVTSPIVFLNSSLNPILYFWRMRELRNVAKETIRKMTRINLN